MKTEIIIALISFLGSVIGTFGGIVASSRITAYRLEQLEKKVDKHNNFAERIPLVEKDIKVLNHRVEDLEEMEKEKDK
ncbi:MAG: hypothetical protein IJI67_07670 [Clostridia bacterium]|nr:hypothetical protein [Clostridia bacterium]